MAWLWPNFGLVLHLYRLPSMCLLGLGYIRPNAAMIQFANNGFQNAKFGGIIYRLGILKTTKLLLFALYKIAIMAVESYDLRAVILVAVLLDGPVWYAFWRNIFGVTTALRFVVFTEIVVVLTQAWQAYFLWRHHRQSLLPPHVGRRIPVGEAASSSSSVTTNKKAD